MVGGADIAKDVKDASGLSTWMLALHAQRCAGDEATRPLAALLTGRPAAGKTSLLSQVVIHSLDRDSDLVPILIRVQLLQTLLLEQPGALAASWNWIDGYLRAEHGASSPLYRMLRQAMTARRALILIDGLDEGGAVRDQIERHVTEVLAPAGHVLLATSRPDGIDSARYKQFHLLELQPLTDTQQRQALQQRLGGSRATALLPYLRRVPVDAATQQRITVRLTRSRTRAY